ncbi:MAG: hypothetical protein OXL98_01980 [Acidimicrobiaceae bacterium]|nr:hypothetical protein [Acidimicrobiaceae bacterium]
MSLWMRWLDFRALRDLLLLLGEHPQGLGASELEKLATAEGVLLRRDGRPYARSIHYHHRRTLERLGLIEKHGARFALSRRNPEIRALNAPTRIGEPLQPEEKEAFANSALRNEDCHQVFFSHFLPAREPVADVATFVERGHAVEVAVQSRIALEAGARGGEGQHRGRNRSKRVAIRAVEAGDWAAFDGAEAVQAIHFGLRSWCVDQLGFLDVAFRPDGTYATYPKHIDAPLTDRDLAVRMFAGLDFDDDWATVRIPDLALAAGIEHGVSIKQAKGVLTEWLTARPDLVAGVPTRAGFITAGLPESQHDLALKRYLKSSSGAYLSHIRIHRDLRQHVQNKVVVQP